MKGLSSSSIPVPDSSLCNFCKDPEIVKQLEKMAKFHYPAQWRMALNLLQYGITIGMRFANNAAPNTASTGQERDSAHEPGLSKSNNVPAQGA